jgi:hypothetical protein
MEIIGYGILLAIGFAIAPIVLTFILIIMASVLAIIATVIASITNIFRSK